MVVQRVDKASVSVNNQVISSIGKGILVFLGIERGDSAGDADLLLEKAINMRIFEDPQGKMNLSLLDVNGELLVVSQFTLLGDCWKGKRPSFIQAESPGPARDLYEYFIKRASEQVTGVVGGQFQAMMKVESINDGPVTMLIDTRKRF